MNIDDIEIHVGEPAFGYVPIRRLEAKVEATSNFSAAPTMVEANAKLRELAAKAGGDAVVDVEYKTGISMTSWRSMTATGLAVRRESDEMSCPTCAETIKRAAKKCRHCDAIIAPNNVPPPSVVHASEMIEEPLRGTNNPTTVYWIVTAIVVLGFIIVLAAQ